MRTHGPYQVEMERTVSDNVGILFCWAKCYVKEQTVIATKMNKVGVNRVNNATSTNKLINLKILLEKALTMSNYVICFNAKI